MWTSNVVVTSALADHWGIQTTYCERDHKCVHSTTRELASMSTSVRGFSVAHQRVSVNIDILKKTLCGWTELTVVPTTLDLKEIRLDARRLTIEKCYINGIESSFDHFDLLSDPPSANSAWDVHQHTLYAEKLKPLMLKDGHSPGELKLNIPDSVKITEPNDATFIASHSTREKTYEPLTLRIFYHINENVPNEGLQFITADPKEAHAYTTHTPIAQATSCWLPCVDGLWSLSTWELEFKIPQMLDPEDPETELVVACNNVAANEEPDPSNSQRKIVKFGVFSPVSSQHVGFAVGPFVQVPIVVSDEKQSRGDFDTVETSQQMYNGRLSHNPDNAETSNNGEGGENNNNGGSADVAMNGGVDDKTASSGANGNSKDEGEMQDHSQQSHTITQQSRRQNQSQTLPIAVYVLPSKASLVPHSCFTLPRAMDYFTRDFGSFPYDSYSVVFVSDFPIMSDTTADACALTLCSNNLLFPADMIEPRFTNCQVLVRGVAAQWCGVNIVPSTWNDLWVTEGIALYMTNLFIRKLMGNNEHRFRLRKGNDDLCREDVDRPPIGRPHFRFPLCPEDLDFIRLKAPLVLFILDRRMTKTDRSLGVSRVLTKLFLQSMSGDLRSQLSTSHFVRQCEKVAHHRLAKFFEEWVYGSGYPIFRITQRFNKKRLCIEMGIGQVHSREFPGEVLSDKTFLERAVTHLDMAEKLDSLSEEDAENLKLLNEMAGVPNEDSGSVGGSSLHLPNFSPPPCFTGPMTIRIHEANGTPYEHVVELRDMLTKIDIPYNTKYKRLRRNQKFKRAAANGKDPALLNEPNDGLINCLGDVLMTDAEISDWMFVDWGDGGEEEEGMFNEAFEWLRADADFEWLGQFFVSQPDYMYASQLQQDRDIVAQYDAVTFFGRQQPNAIYCTVLTRTIMDSRYYYGVRVAAAYELAKLAVPQLHYAGMHLLMRIFRELYCFHRSKLPRANNFQNFASYFVQKAIPQALSRIRNQSTGRCPTEICRFIMDMIRYNENSENLYSDTLYLVNLLECATNTLRPVNVETGEISVRGNLSADDNEELRSYVADVVSEIDKSQRLDRWVPSHLRVATTSAIKMEELLILAGYGEPRMDKLLQSAQHGETNEVKLAAIESILHLSGYRDTSIMKFLSEAVISNPSRTMHFGILNAWKTVAGHVAIHGEYSQETNPRSLRQMALARKLVRTAIPLLRDTLGQAEPFQKALWQALRSTSTGSSDRLLLLELCQVLYTPEEKLIARMKMPPMYQISMKRRRDFVMVAKYRNVLKKHKSIATHPEPSPTRSSTPQSNGQPKIRLKLR